MITAVETLFIWMNQLTIGLEWIDLNSTKFKFDLWNIRSIFEYLFMNEIQTKAIYCVKKRYCHCYYESKKIYNERTKVRKIKEKKTTLKLMIYELNSKEKNAAYIVEMWRTANFTCNLPNGGNYEFLPLTTISLQFDIARVYGEGIRHSHKCSFGSKGECLKTLPESLMEECIQKFINSSSSTTFLLIYNNKFLKVLKGMTSRILGPYWLPDPHLLSWEKLFTKSCLV